MNRCSSYNAHCNMVGPCSCGLFHTTQSTNNSNFSMLFSSFDSYNQGDFCPFTSHPPSSSSSSVDCTLSLGTPSTRLMTSNLDNDKRSSSTASADQQYRRPAASSYVSNFCWDILQPKTTSKPNRNGGGGSGGDPLLARRCANCDTTSTPLWRNGPRGPKSLCNACGIRFKKEERRASAAAATNGGGAGMMVDTQHMINSSWVQNTPTKIPSCYSPAAAAAMGNEFRFIDDVDDRDSPFLSWRLNVTDRPGLVHDFTR